MITYHPPKSQIWGHSRNRLTAAQLLERSETFLRDQAVIVTEAQPHFIFRWVPSHNDPVSAAVDALANAVGLQFELKSSPEFESAAREIDYKIPRAKLGATAAWLDELDRMVRDQRYWASLTMFVFFQWKELSVRSQSALAPLPESEFGLHLAPLRAVTTLFRFNDVEHYQRVKEYLASIDLVQLSDRHIRPKGALDAS